MASDVENNGKQRRRLGGRSGRGFMPGQSGNPGGRPKVQGEIRELARQYTGLAVETLAHIMQHGDKDAARVAAAQALLDRGWGKAAQAVDMGGDMSVPIRTEIVVRHVRVEADSEGTE